MGGKYLDSSGLSYLWGKLKAYFQEKLVSGTNIKTINNESVLGSGNISISGGVSDVTIDNSSVVTSGVAKLVTFAGGSSSSSSNKAGVVPKPPTIGESGQWHLLSDGGWIEAYPQTDSAIPWASKYTTVNDKSLSSNITLTASDVGAVPTTRKVNNKALSSDITLSASDVGAVPTTRKVNNKALSSDITLSASDVGALATSGGNITGNLSYKSSSIDASLANNGVSSTQYPTTFNILDKSGRILTRKEAVIESGGNISAYWYVRNYNTSGTQVGQKGIKITMEASGHLDWSNQTDGDSKVIMKSALAFWNGRYSGSGSNLEYCTQGRIVGRNQICYANSRVDTFSSGAVTLSLSTLGITTGAKPVGILLTPEYSSGVTMKYDYDGSSASGVKIYAYTANGSAYSGALRYFAVVFQNTWTST